MRDWRAGPDSNRQPPAVLAGVLAYKHFLPMSPVFPGGSAFILNTLLAQQNACTSTQARGYLRTSLSTGSGRLTHSVESGIRLVGCRW